MRGGGEEEGGLQGKKRERGMKGTSVEGWGEIRIDVVCDTV